MVPHGDTGSPRVHVSLRHISDLGRPRHSLKSRCAMFKVTSGYLELKNSKALQNMYP